jgi:hypothetical protein
MIDSYREKYEESEITPPPHPHHSDLYIKCNVENMSNFMMT